MRRRSLIAGVGSAAVLLATRGDGVAQAVAPSPLDLSGYEPSFATDFSRPLLRQDGGPFSPRYDAWGGVRTLPNNKELELYVDPSFVSMAGESAAKGGPPSGDAPMLPALNPFTVEDGVLVISARPTPPAWASRVGLPYISGMISTDRTFAQQYGYFEMLAQLPAGQGLWPAFWLVGRTQAYHVELDIMEALGHERNRIYQTVHPHEGAGTPHLTPVGVSFDPTAGMHSYGMEWTPDVLRFYVDRKLTVVAAAAPFRGEVPMYMIANLAVGGTWGGNPDASTRFPAELRIAHIRAWRLRDGAPT